MSLSDGNGLADACERISRLMREEITEASLRMGEREMEREAVIHNRAVRIRASHMVKTDHGSMIR